MNIIELSSALKARGYDCGAPGWGAATRVNLYAALEDGPDWPLSGEDVELAADRLGVTPAHIRTIWQVEAAGVAFIGGRPTILFEPHRFSKATKGRFDATHPDVSYKTWDRTKYPKTQAERYAQLVKAVELDIDAGFASASYGGPQILGENYALCGFPNPFEFAFAMATSEGDQLDAFVAFVKARKLDGPLRRGEWQAFADGYNGTASRLNKYAEKLAAAFKKFSTKAPA